MADGLDLFATPRARRAVVVAASMLVLVRLGATDLWPPDEPRYALVAEEVRSFEHGLRGLVLLHLRGEPYTQKPPLYYWLAAASGAPFGRVDEVAARLPSALAGVATVALAMALGTLFAGRGAGTLAGLLLATTFDWSWTARSVQLDTLLACCETAALLAFWRIETGAGARRAGLAAFHAALGLAVLTKGPVGFAVPFLAIAAYLAWERRLGALPGLLHPAGLALSLGPALAWVGGAVALGPPGYFRAAVVENLFGRFGARAAHAQPFAYYLERFPPDLLPWLLLLPAALVAGRRALAADADTEERRSWRFLVAWIATSFALFSLTPAKRLRYLLPIEPASALLFALVLRRWLGARGARRLAFGAIGLWLAQLVAYTVVIPARLDPERSPRPIAVAARALAGADGTIGLYRAADLANGIAYYGAGRLDAFREPDGLARFAASGGRVLVFEDERRAEVERAVPIEVRGHYRLDGETWLVAVVRD